MRLAMTLPPKPAATKQNKIKICFFIYKKIQTNKQTNKQKQQKQILTKTFFYKNKNKNKNKTKTLALAALPPFAAVQSIGEGS